MTATEIIEVNDPRRDQILAEYLGEQKIEKAPGRPKVDYKAQLLQQLAVLNLSPSENEYRFCERKWRFDWAYPHEMLAIEYQGGVYYKGMGHQTTSGFAKDCLKFSTAASLGWRIILVTAGMVRDGSAVRLIESALTR